MNGRAAFGWLTGLTLTAIPIWQTVRDLDLRTVGVEATVQRVDPPPPRSKQGSTAFVTDASGRELRCYDWDLEVGELVLYDPRDRLRCRAAADIGWPNLPQWLTLGGGLLILFLGVLAQLHEWEIRHRKRS